jgi:hypothetical protein
MVTVLDVVQVAQMFVASWPFAIAIVPTTQAILQLMAGPP